MQKEILITPKFISQIINNKKCTIHGEGKTRRNFIYINDLIKALIIILHNGEINNIYNIGTDNEYSVLEIANKIIKYLKPNEKIDDWIEFTEDRIFNDFRYKIFRDFENATDVIVSLFPLCIPKTHV